MNQEIAKPESVEQATEAAATSMMVSDANDFASAPLVSAERPDVFCNFDGDKMDKYRLACLATGPDCKSFEDLGDNALALRYWFVHRCQLNGETQGEIVDAVRTVLIDDNNVAYAFVSDGIVAALQTFVKVVGPGPYDPAIQIRIVRVKTRLGRQLYKFAPAEFGK